MSIDRATSVPVHVQIENELRTLIEDGALKPGSQLPTEVKLAARFGVNRLTMRQAIAELRRAGLVIARQGVGTFVADPVQTFDVELSATDWLVEHERAARAASDEGRKVSEELLDVAVVQASGEPAEYLGRGQVLWLELLHRVDGRPSIRSQYWTRSKYSPAEVSALAADEISISIVREIVGFDMYYAWRSFDAAAASRRDATVLTIEPGSPMLRRCGLNTDEDGRPLLYLQRDAPRGRMRIVIRHESPH